MVSYGLVLACIYGLLQVGVERVKLLVSICLEKETCVTPLIKKPVWPPWERNLCDPLRKKPMWPPPPYFHLVMEKCEGHYITENLSCPQRETCVTHPPPIFTTQWKSWRLEFQTLKNVWLVAGKKPVLPAPPPSNVRMQRNSTRDTMPGAFSFDVGNVPGISNQSLPQLKPSLCYFPPIGLLPCNRTKICFQNQLFICTELFCLCICPRARQ